MAAQIIVYDVGTSSLKAAVYSDSAEVVAKASKYYEFSSVKAGWAEIDPRVWWDSLVAVTEDLRAENVDLSEIRGIAITGQMHSGVLLNETDEVISPSILWLDRRASLETEELQRTFSCKPYKLNSSSTLSKLYWQSKNQRDILDQVKTILWPKDYLRFLLTGIKATDYTEGIGSALIDWDKKEWISERIEFCGLDPAVLPEMKGQEELVPIKAEVADRLGFSKDCEVLIGLGDMAALLGGAPHKKGRLVYSMGSSSQYFAEVDFKPDDSGGLYSLELGDYKLYGGISTTAGASLKWIHEKLWDGEQSISFDDMIDAALQISDQEDPVMFFPFLAGERSPFWSDSLSGSFEGLKLHHNRAHLTKAVMEGIAFSINYILDLMEKAGIEIEEIALSGGGVNTKGWPEIIASATGRVVKIFNAEETVTTVLYAVMSSAFSGKSFRSILADLFDEPKVVLPETELHQVYKTIYSKYKYYLEMKVEMDNSFEN